MILTLTVIQLLQKVEIQRGSVYWCTVYQRDMLIACSTRQSHRLSKDKMEVETLSHYIPIDWFRLIMQLFYWEVSLASTRQPSLQYARLLHVQDLYRIISVFHAPQFRKMREMRVQD